MRYIRIIGSMFFLSIKSFLFSATIGSDTAVNRFNTQQILQQGDRVAGFAALAGGFRLLTFSTTATFDSFFGVSGAADINGGTLSLTRDLIFDNVTTFNTVGNILGNNHTLELSSSMNAIPLAQPHDCSVTLVTSVNVGSQITSISWSNDDQYLAIGTAAGNVTVYSFNGSTLTSIDTESPGGTVFSVDWHPTGNCIGAGRSADLLGLGPQIFVYSFNPGAGTLTQIDSDFYSLILLATGDVNAVKWHTSGSFFVIGGSKATQQLRLYPVNANCTLNTGGAVNVNTGQTVNPDALAWNVAGTFLATGQTNLRVYAFTPSPLGVALNAQTAGSLDCRCVSWNPIITNYLAAGFATSTQRLRIYSHNSGAGTLTQIAAQTTSVSVRDVNWNPLSSQCLAVGLDANAGGEFLMEEFDPTALTLSVASSFENGAQTGATDWSSSGRYVATGDDNGKLAIYQTNTPDTCFTWTNVNVVLNTDVALRCCLTLSGNCGIYGMGNRLSLASSCTLLFDRSAKIAFYDIEVNGITNDKFRCLDNTTTLTLVDTTLLFDNAYTFTVGKIDIVGQTQFKGNSFSYQSTQPITIQSGSSLVLDGGITFSYTPTNSANNLLRFIDRSSQLALTDATLFASAVGLNLTRGTLVIDGASLLFSQGTNTSQAISFGDGISSGNNMRIEFLPAGVLLCNGFIVNNNV